MEEKKDLKVRHEPHPPSYPPFESTADALRALPELQPLHEDPRLGEELKNLTMDQSDPSNKEKGEHTEKIETKIRDAYITPQYVDLDESKHHRQDMSSSRQRLALLMERNIKYDKDSIEQTYNDDRVIPVESRMKNNRLSPTNLQQTLSKQNKKIIENNSRGFSRRSAFSHSSQNSFRSDTSKITAQDVDVMAHYINLKGRTASRRSRESYRPFSRTRATSRRSGDSYRPFSGARALSRRSRDSYRPLSTKRPYTGRSTDSYGRHNISSPKRRLLPSVSPSKTQIDAATEVADLVVAAAAVAGLTQQQASAIAGASAEAVKRDKRSSFAKSGVKNNSNTNIDVQMLAKSPEVTEAAIFAATTAGVSSTELADLAEEMDWSINEFKNAKGSVPLSGNIKTSNNSIEYNTELKSLKEHSSPDDILIDAKSVNILTDAVSAASKAGLKSELFEAFVVAVEKSCEENTDASASDIIRIAAESLQLNDTQVALIGAAYKREVKERRIDTSEVDRIYDTKKAIHTESYQKNILNPSKLSQHVKFPQTKSSTAPSDRVSTENNVGYMHSAKTSTGSLNSKDTLENDTVEDLLEHQAPEKEINEIFEKSTDKAMEESKIKSVGESRNKSYEESMNEHPQGVQAKKKTEKNATIQMRDSTKSIPTKQLKHAEKESLAQHRKSKIDELEKTLGTSPELQITFAEFASHDAFGARSRDGKKGSRVTREISGITIAGLAKANKSTTIFKNMERSHWGTLQPKGLKLLQIDNRGFLRYGAECGLASLRGYDIKPATVDLAFHAVKAMDETRLRFLGFSRANAIICYDAKLSVSIFLSLLTAAAATRSVQREQINMAQQNMNTAANNRKDAIGLELQRTLDRESVQGRRRYKELLGYARQLIDTENNRIEDVKYKMRHDQDEGNIDLEKILNAQKTGNIVPDERDVKRVAEAKNKLGPAGYAKDFAPAEVEFAGFDQPKLNQKAAAIAAGKAAANCAIISGASTQQASAAAAKAVMAAGGSPAIMAQAAGEAAAEQIMAQKDIQLQLRVAQEIATEKAEWENLTKTATSVLSNYGVLSSTAKYRSKDAIAIDREMITLLAENDDSLAAALTKTTSRNVALANAATKGSLDTQTVDAFADIDGVLPRDFRTGQQVLDELGKPAFESNRKPTRLEKAKIWKQEKENKDRLSIKPSAEKQHVENFAALNLDIFPTGIPDDGLLDALAITTEPEQYISHSTLDRNRDTELHDEIVSPKVESSGIHAKSSNEINEAPSLIFGKFGLPRAGAKLSNRMPVLVNTNDAWVRATIIEVTTSSKENEYGNELYSVLYEKDNRIENNIKAERLRLISAREMVKTATQDPEVFHIKQQRALLLKQWRTRRDEERNANFNTAKKENFVDGPTGLRKKIPGNDVTTAEAARILFSKSNFKEHQFRPFMYRHILSDEPESLKDTVENAIRRADILRRSAAREVLREQEQARWKETIVARQNEARKKRYDREQEKKQIEKERQFVLAKEAEKKQHAKDLEAYNNTKGMLPADIWELKEPQAVVFAREEKLALELEAYETVAEASEEVQKAINNVTEKKQESLRRSKIRGQLPSVTRGLRDFGVEVVEIALEKAILKESAAKAAAQIAAANARQAEAEHALKIRQRLLLVEPENQVKVAMEACAMGNVVWLDQVLSIIPVDISDKDGLQLIHHAARAADIAAMKLLVSHGALTTALDSAGRSPLHHTILSCPIGGLGIKAEKSLKSVVWLLDVLREGGEKQLIEHITRVDGFGRTLLDLAAWQGSVDICKLLHETCCAVTGTIEAGDDPEGLREARRLQLWIPLIMKEDRKKWTALHYACKRGHLSIARFLCANGASLMAKDTNGQTPQDVAQSEGHIHICEFIREAATQKAQITTLRKVHAKKMRALKEEVKISKKDVETLQAALKVKHKNIELREQQVGESMAQLVDKYGSDKMEWEAEKHRLESLVIDLRKLVEEKRRLAPQLFTGDEKARPGLFVDKLPTEYKENANSAIKEIKPNSVKESTSRKIIRTEKLDDIDTPGAIKIKSVHQVRRFKMKKHKIKRDIHDAKRLLKNADINKGVLLKAADHTSGEASLSNRNMEIVTQNKISSAEREIIAQYESKLEADWRKKAISLGIQNPKSILKPFPTLPNSISNDSIDADIDKDEHISRHLQKIVSESPKKQLGEEQETKTTPNTKIASKGRGLLSFLATQKEHHNVFKKVDRNNSNESLQNPLIDTPTNDLFQGRDLASEISDGKLEAVVTMKTSGPKSLVNNIAKNAKRSFLRDETHFSTGKSRLDLAEQLLLSHVNKTSNATVGRESINEVKSLRQHRKKSSVESIRNLRHAQGRNANLLKREKQFQLDMEKQIRMNKKLIDRKLKSDSVKLKVALEESREQVLLNRRGPVLRKIPRNKKIRMKALSAPNIKGFGFGSTKHRQRQSGKAVALSKGRGFRKSKNTLQKRGFSSKKHKLKKKLNTITNRKVKGLAHSPKLAQRATYRNLNLTSPKSLKEVQVTEALTESWGIVGGGRNRYEDDTCHECGRLACSCAGRLSGINRVDDLDKSGIKLKKKTDGFTFGSFAKGEPNDYRDDLSQFLSLENSKSGFGLSADYSIQGYGDDTNRTKVERRKSHQTEYNDIEREPFDPNQIGENIALALFGYGD